MRLRLAFVLACFLPSILCLAQFPQETDLNMLTETMCGTYTATEQSIDEDALEVTLMLTRIWKDEEDVWIYAEQKSSDAEKVTYRRDIYQLVMNGKNKFIQTVFDPEKEEAWIGAVDKPKLVKSLSPSNLILRDGCTIGFVYSNGTYAGSTQDRCAFDWKGATLATSEITLSEGMMVSWNRGWTDQGQQIWGPTQGGYVFIKE